MSVIVEEMHEETGLSADDIPAVECAAVVQLPARKPAGLFHVLPTDVMKHVLMVWLKNVDVLSKMDIACCNHSWQPLLRECLQGVIASTSVTYKGRRAFDLFAWAQQRAMLLDVWLKMNTVDMETILPYLPTLSKLMSLTICGQHCPCREHWQAFFASIPTLTTLKIARDNGDIVLEDLLQTAGALRLRSLHLNLCMTAETEGMVIKMFPLWGSHLTEVILTGSNHLSNSTLQAIGECAALLRLHLSCRTCYYTKAGLIALLSKLSKLTELYINGDEGEVDEEVLLQALPHLPQLHSLHLAVCFGIKAAALVSTLAKCNTLLDYLKINHEVDLKDAALQEFLHPPPPPPPPAEGEGEKEVEDEEEAALIQEVHAVELTELLYEEDGQPTTEEHEQDEGNDSNEEEEEEARADEALEDADEDEAGEEDAEEEGSSSEEEGEDMEEEDCCWESSSEEDGEFEEQELEEQDL